MDKLRKAYRFGKNKYNLLAFKKYTTIAGTLVFFLIMSIVPLTFWLTLILGRLPVDVDRILALPVFDSVKEIFLYVQQEAQTATASASVLLVVTTLYSSTTLFYQMRRSGEIIYEYKRPKKGLKLRLSALLLFLLVLLAVVVLAVVLAIGTFLFSRFFSAALERLADYLLLTVVSFALVLVLNAYICPYRMPLKSFLSGAVITVAAWAIAVVGFTVYLRISNMSKLYGALSTIIVFLLWLYVLMICFIAGVIFNSEKIANVRTRYKKKKITQTA